MDRPFLGFLWASLLWFLPSRELSINDGLSLILGVSVRMARSGEWLRSWKGQHLVRVGGCLQDKDTENLSVKQGKGKQEGRVTAETISLVARTLPGAK